jgi:LacI family transcriptional regulator
MNADIRAVAERAGVSIATVSRALNNKPGRISAATQERVRKAARDLGYQPNRLGVGLQAGLMPVLGLVIPDVRNAYFHDVIRGAEEAAFAADCNVILANTSRSPETECAVVDSLLAQRVRAILFAGGGVSNDRHLRDIDWGRTRVAAIGSHALDVPSVDWDQQAVAATATEHLAEQGCRYIVYLGGQPNWLTYQHRLRGYRMCLRDHGLTQSAALEWPANPTAVAGALEVARHLRRRTRFDGIVAFSDYLAFGAVTTLIDAGVSVRDDVKVVGCDDVDLCSYTRPSLSSVRLNAYEIARDAAARALDDEELLTSRTTQPTFELVVRQSSSAQGWESASTF